MREMSTAYRTFGETTSEMAVWKSEKQVVNSTYMNCMKMGNLLQVYLMFIGPCTILIVEYRETNLMSLAILFHFLCAQHVSDVNTSFLRSLQLI